MFGAAEPLGAKVTGFANTICLMPCKFQVSNDENKHRNTKNILPVLTEIFWAIILPPITASPVHKQCPRVPPTATPKGSWIKQTKRFMLMLKKIIPLCLHSSERHFLFVVWKCNTPLWQLG